MQTPPPLVATLVLVDATGAVLGMLPPVAVPTPWWSHVAPIVEAVQARDGLRVTILRLLAAQQEAPHGGAVTYLAQVDALPARVTLQPWAGALPDHPLRHAYARPGGPQADLAWANAVLQSRALVPAGPAEQVRTWNLSSLWRLPLVQGAAAWLKVVPPFFAHEGVLLARLGDDGAPVPRLLGHEHCRMLLAEVDGEDLYDAGEAQGLAMIERLVTLQQRWLGRVDELLALGLPDWRGAALAGAATALLERRAPDLAADQRAVLGRFVHLLPQRFAAIADCGIPDGLVHGDFHPGNFRGAGAALTLLDWGDSGIGHPLLDQPAFLSRLPPERVESARNHWAGAWQRCLPQADAARAAELLAPVASLRTALNYQRFLDHIEDAEHPYHRADVGDWLARTAEHLQAQPHRSGPAQS